jgi:hypothetical protein
LTDVNEWTSYKMYGEEKSAQHIRY